MIEQQLESFEVTEFFDFLPAKSDDCAIFATGGFLACCIQLANRILPGAQGSPLFSSA